MPMIDKPLICLLAAAAVLAGGTALASDIYRYTDADGNVHYVDRPTGAPSEERVAIASSRTDNVQVQARLEARNTRREQVAAAESGDEPEMTRAEELAERQAQAKKCQMYRDRLETFVTSRRLYREEANGERVYLDEAETQEARDQAQALVEEHCS